jgi:hypothetical protein
MIVTKALKQPQQDHAPATIDHDRNPTRKRSGDRQATRKEVVDRPQIIRCPMSPTTQQVQHSPIRHIKYMPFSYEINI